MGMNEIPSSERVHIGFFGRTNVGKSSIINAVTNQNLSIVSEISGTTTDPVKKTMELLPIGPVVIIDTPGMEDGTALSFAREEKSREVLSSCDIVVIVADCAVEIGETEKKLINLAKKYNTEYVLCFNKCDLREDFEAPDGGVCVSAHKNININKLKELIAAKVKHNEKKIIGDKISQGMTLALVIPIDKSAPKGRLILPQQAVLKEIIDAHACAVCLQPEELEAALKTMKIDVVITDSQAFAVVDKIVPSEMPLTSFSILMMNYKGELEEAVNGAKMIDKLSDGDKVLICEGCTHHRQCEDIGTVKIPKMITAYTGAQLDFKAVSGGDFPKDLSEYSLIVHCGGCMLTEKEIKRRMSEAKKQNIPITNYGIAIAKTNGILNRVLNF